MDSVEDLIERLEYARSELKKALAHESKVMKQSQKAIKDSLDATKAAAKLQMMLLIVSKRMK